ncbi:hypothetical protein ACFQ08_35960 [Streptosporangium algeriense]|uniref:HTH cro/C1-type domain-containing protein n=1 Tax=Streptosporangium algeriense TaxID=1682748 RepID=A0ABW3E1K7_9ACTN
MIPLIADLVELRRTARIQGREVAQALGLGASAGPSMVSRWESGQTIPVVGHVIGYAHAVGHQLVVVRDGEEAVALDEVLTDLAGLRTAAGLSRAAVAECLWITASAVAHLERTAGPRTQLTALLRYLGALGCVLVLVPLEAVER